MTWTYRGFREWLGQRFIHRLNLTSAQPHAHLRLLYGEKFTHNLDRLVLRLWEIVRNLESGWGV